VRKLSYAFLLGGAGLALFAVLYTTQARAAMQTVVTAAQVNGTWDSKHGAFKVWALGNQKLKVEFDGVYEYTSSAGPMANTGEGRGIAFIEGNTAIFRPDGAEDECKITMKFTRGKLIVTQESNCGFGHNVTADGTYRKTSSRKPKFDED
jgi:hypothetical protein